MQSPTTRSDRSVANPVSSPNTVPPATDAVAGNGALVSARGISKNYGERAVLQDIDISIDEGQVVTLIGPNGAGKTTLVRILLGLISADEGRVRRRPGLRIGYMPQRMTVERTLPLTVARFLKLGSGGGQQAMQDTLALLGIARLQDRQLAAVSGGELQRVLLARALSGEPHLLILDEPAQGVDLAGQAELYKLIGNVGVRRGCGVLMISHDLHLVMSSTDEVVCLNHHVCCHGKPEQVSSDPAFLDLFGARLSPSLAVYTHHHNHEHDIHGEVKPVAE